MANFASIGISFTGVPNLDAQIAIAFTKNAIQYTRTWYIKTVRAQAWQVTRGVNAADQFSKFIAAVSADLDNDDVYGNFRVVTFGTNGTLIEANEYGWSPVFGYSFTYHGGGITGATTNEVLPVKDFRLTGYSIAAGTVPCSDVALTIIEADGVAPYTWVTPSNAATGLTAQIARGVSNQTISVTLEDSEANQATLASVVIPQTFTTALVTSVSVVPNAGGLDASITAFLTNPDSIFTYEYSIDGSNFQTSNVFPNLTDGDYTLYVTDGFGCLITYPFTVDIQNEIVRLDPYELIPKSNSLRFVKQVIKQYQTLDNTLYHESDYHGEYRPKYYQKYQSGDGKVITQFRSNYETITANLYDCAGELVQPLDIYQKSQNIGAEDKRDCTIFNLGDNQTGVFFTTGNIYDPGTTDITGTYNLNGNVPEWGIIGNTIVMAGVGSFIIKSVTYNDEVKANILVIDNTWTSANETEAKISECTYNRQPYEVYEAELNMNLLGFLGFEYYTVVINMTDSLYPVITYNSERIQVKDYHKDTFYLEYTEGPFSGIDYNTTPIGDEGMKGKLRLKGLDPYHTLTPGGESTLYKDSLSEPVKLKDVPTMEGTLYISEVPRYMVEKIRLAMSHENLWINGEKWMALENIDVQSFNHSALRNINVKLQRLDYEPYATNFIDLDGQQVEGQQIIE
jgi:hypothetical protein